MKIKLACLDWCWTSPLGSKKQMKNKKGVPNWTPQTFLSWTCSKQTELLSLVELNKFGKLEKKTMVEWRSVLLLTTPHPFLFLKFLFLFFFFFLFFLNSFFFLFYFVASTTHQLMTMTNNTMKKEGSSLFFLPWTNTSLVVVDCMAMLPPWMWECHVAPCLFFIIPTIKN